MGLGIYEDTGSFTFAATSEGDFSAAAFLRFVLHVRSTDDKFCGSLSVCGCVWCVKKNLLHADFRRCFVCVSDISSHIVGPWE